MPPAFENAAPKIYLSNILTCLFESNTLAIEKASTAIFSTTEMDTYRSLKFSPK